MEEFRNNEQGYLDWIAAHPGGFVVNTTRSHNPAETRLHRATCDSISTDRTTNYTTNDYYKICAERRVELEDWAKRYLGLPLKECSLCNPE